MAALQFVRRLSTALLAYRLYFTTSPLPWPEHLAMFDKLVRAFAGTADVAGP